MTVAPVRVATLLRLSVATAVVTIVLKTAAWWITGSVGLLSDAMESLVNLASALFALAMVTIAARPADDDHPFGHTKAEYFSSAFEGLMIAAAAIAIVWAALRRFAESSVRFDDMVTPIAITGSSQSQPVSWTRTMPTTTPADVHTSA